MQFTLASALLAIVVFQLLFIAFFLLTLRKGKRKSNRILGIFFLMIGLSMLDMWLSIHGLYRYYERLAFIDDGFILALGPLVFIYAKTIIYKGYKISRSDYIHFIPFLLVTLYFLIVSILSTKEEQHQLVEGVNNFSLPFYMNLIGTSLYLHAFIYLIISSREVKNYKKRIYEEYSSIMDRNYDWLKFSINSLGVVILLAVIHALVPYSFSSAYAQISAIFFIGFIFYFANRVIIKGLIQPDLFSGISGNYGPKYVSSNLTTEQRQTYQTKLVNEMETDKHYLNPDLTINQLADIIDIPSKTLSQVINQSFNQSFFDFINSYRVEEAKQIIDHSTDTKLTVQEVMYQSGFNSKSSFIAFFKKRTGMTPSEYKKKSF